MTPKPAIVFYVDVVSPFCYEAFHILRNDTTFAAVNITYVPIFLGGLMKACGNTAPIRIKNKDKWINTERVRWARLFGIPMREDPPPDFPPNTLETMRALSAIPNGSQQDALVAALDRLFRAHWVDHAPVAQPDVFAPILREALGDEAAAAKVLADASSTGKTALKSNTDRAFAAGAFGLPWMECTDRAGRTEGFWGVDHLGQVAQFLGLEKPALRAWKSIL
ncbi:thioredoxin-like protein [Xylariaceae sp. FL0662B]|nr:thioredoxin-like protein [Xylariaceae sp. FL0662B]